MRLREVWRRSVKHCAANFLSCLEPATPLASTTSFTVITRHKFEMPFFFSFLECWLYFPPRGNVSWTLDCLPMLVVCPRPFPAKQQTQRVNSVDSDRYWFMKLTGERANSSCSRWYTGPGLQWVFSMINIVNMEIYTRDAGRNIHKDSSSINIAAVYVTHNFYPSHILISSPPTIAENEAWARLLFANTCFTAAT